MQYYSVLCFYRSMEAGNDNISLRKMENSSVINAQNVKNNAQCACVQTVSFGANSPIFDEFLKTSSMPDVFMPIAETKPAIDEESAKTTVKSESTSKEKENKRQIAWFSLAGATLAVLCGVLLQPRFFGSYAQKAIKNFATYMDNVIRGISPTLDKIVKESIKIPQFALTKFFNLANNLASFKDIFLKTVTDKIPPLRFFDKQSAKLYKTMGIKSTANGYSRALDKFGKSNENIAGVLENFSKNPENLAKTVEINGVTKTAGEWAQDVKKLLEQRGNSVKAIDAGKETRFEEVQEIMRGLDTEMKNKMGSSIKKFRMVRDFSKDFMAQEARAGEKAANIKKLESLKADVDLKSADIKNILDGILGKENADKMIKPLEKSSSKALGKAISTEGNEFFDKVRDITNGAAQSDVYSILLTTGLMSVYLAQAESAEERKHVTLTTGIPLISAISASMFASMKMIAGAKAIVFGLVTGFVANKIGEFVDNIYTHNLEEKKNQKDWIPTIVDLQKDVEQVLTGERTISDISASNKK